ncbi:hypothetical protein RJT34_31950 [Clitoria ternatea]|uniref:Uncharacterized protein n=1 Tax=Clitoria ternatea TaxID=43366 RepID=A0AAN9EWT0_CLITE
MTWAPGASTWGVSSASASPWDIPPPRFSGTDCKDMAAWTGSSSTTDPMTASASETSSTVISSSSSESKRLTPLDSLMSPKIGPVWPSSSLPPWNLPRVDWDKALNPRDPIQCQRGASCLRSAISPGLRPEAHGWGAPIPPEVRGTHKFP